jgi:hypothetical protein
MPPGYPCLDHLGDLAVAILVPRSAAALQQCYNTVQGLRRNALCGPRPTNLAIWLQKRNRRIRGFSADPAVRLQT